MQSRDSTDSKSAQNIACLIKQSGSFVKKRREQAYAELAALPLSEVLEPLLGQITSDLKKVRGSFLRKMLPIPIILVGQLLFLGLFSRVIEANAVHGPIARQLLLDAATVEAIVLMVSGLAQFGLLSLLATASILAQCRNFRIQNIAKLLMSSDDARVVGPLTEVICRSDRELRNSVFSDRTALSSALPDLLPLVTSADADLLNASQRRRLREALNKTTASPFLDEKECRTAIAMLRCLATIGDPDALKIVERATQRSVSYPLEQEVVDQAQESLRTLQEQKERNRLGATLLRGSESPTAQANELLRGVSAGTETDSHQLLRAQGETLQSNRASTVVSKRETETQEVLYVGTGNRVD